MKMRLLIAFAATALLAGPAFAAPAPETSWGKPGVSFDDYRSDATMCLREAARTDLTGTEPANALVAATRRIESVQRTGFTPTIAGGGSTSPTPTTGGFDQAIESATRIQQERASARVDLRLQQAREILQRRMDRCLAGHGYRRFHLTDAQREHLRHMPSAAPERQTYLHSLASDPTILAAQGEPTTR